MEWDTEKIYRKSVDLKWIRMTSTWINETLMGWEDKVSTTIVAKEALERRETVWVGMGVCMCGCWGNHVRGISEAQALPASLQLALYTS